MDNHNALIRKRVQVLRAQGHTYSEIQKNLNRYFPKGTLSYWCKGVVLPQFYKEKVTLLNKKNLENARKKALLTKERRRKEYFEKLELSNRWLLKVLRDEASLKLILATLYLTEGSKYEAGALVLGNSDPDIIKLFLNLLRRCYSIDEKKFRCTVQCRADQDALELEKFWREMTGIPQRQFYTTRIDKRTVGILTRKQHYKGVCRITYLSASMYHELKIISRMLTKHKGS